MRPVIVCLCCGQQRLHKGRGLCGRCYANLRNHGGLSAYPVSYVKVDADAAVERAKERVKRMGLGKRKRLADT